MTLAVVRIALITVLAASASAPSMAYTVNIGSSPDAVFLRVGDGGAGTYRGNGGTPGTSATINKVTATVPAAVFVASPRTPVAMVTDTTQVTSSYDGFVFCNANQLYIGGFVRGGTRNGTLAANAPANLTDSSGQTIPFSQISWTSSGIGDGTNAQPVPAGAFDAAGGAQTLATFNRNTWRESCLSFSYANSAIVAAGTYTGRVTYTLSVP